LCGNYNIILIDKINHTVERFEPHSEMKMIDDSYINRILEEK